MAGQPWFRLYGEMLDDPKVGTLTDAQFRAWVNLMCAQNNHGADDGCTDMDVAALAWAIRIDPAVFQAEILPALVDRGFVHLEDGLVVVDAWADRQFKSDSSTERVRNHRRRKREQRCGNVSVTPPETESESKNPLPPLQGGEGSGAKAPEEEPPADPADSDRRERVLIALNAWNRVLAGTRLVLPPGAGVGEHCVATRDIPPEIASRAEEIAMAVRRSRKLREEATWCSFAWAMKPRNADKLLAGQWPPDAAIPRPRPELEVAVAQREAAFDEATREWLENLSAEDRAIVDAGGIPRPRQPAPSAESVADGIVALRERLGAAPRKAESEVA